MNSALNSKTSLYALCLFLLESCNRTISNLKKSVRNFLRTFKLNGSAYLYFILIRITLNAVRFVQLIDLALTMNGPERIRVYLKEFNTTVLEIYQLRINLL